MSLDAAVEAERARREARKRRREALAAEAAAQFEAAEQRAIEATRAVLLLRLRQGVSYLLDVRARAAAHQAWRAWLDEHLECRAARAANHLGDSPVTALLALSHTAPDTALDVLVDAVDTGLVLAQPDPLPVALALRSDEPSLCYPRDLPPTGRAWWVARTLELGAPVREEDLAESAPLPLWVIDDLIETGQYGPRILMNATSETEYVQARTEPSRLDLDAIDRLGWFQEADRRRFVAACSSGGATATGGALLPDPLQLAVRAAQGDIEAALLAAAAGFPTPPDVLQALERAPDSMWSLPERFLEDPTLWPLVCSLAQEIGFLKPKTLTHSLAKRHTRAAIWILGRKLRETLMSDDLWSASDCCDLLLKFAPRKGTSPAVKLWRNEAAAAQAYLSWVGRSPDEARSALLEGDESLGEHLALLSSLDPAIVRARLNPWLVLGIEEYSLSSREIERRASRRKRDQRSVHAQALISWAVEEIFDQRETQRETTYLRADGSPKFCYPVKPELYSLQRHRYGVYAPPPEAMSRSSPMSTRAVLEKWRRAAISAWIPTIISGEERR